MNRRAPKVLVQSHHYWPERLQHHNKEERSGCYRAVESGNQSMARCHRHQLHLLPTNSNLRKHRLLQRLFSRQTVDKPCHCVASGHNHPKHPYTQSLISAIPVPDPHNKSERQILTGDVPSPINPPSGCSFHPRCPHVQDQCKHNRPELRATSSTTQLIACHFDV